MICTFYKTTDDPIKITKQLTDCHQTTCDIIFDTNIVTPSIIVNSEYIDFNYVYLNDLHRYYYVSDIVISTGYIILKLTLDVLYTYKEEILNNPFFVTRVSNYHTTDIPDNIITTDKVVQTSKPISENIITNNLNFLLGVR